MKVGALGTLVWDQIWHPSGGAAGPVEQWGGAAYSLAALSAATPAGASVHPLVKVGADLRGEAEVFLRGLPHVAVGAGVRVVDAPNNRVELRYRDSAERSERLTGGIPGWSWAELEPLLHGLDAIYVNFISGFELDLPTARRLRKAFSGPIYADLHSLFLGPPGDGARAPRPLPEWEGWLGCFDMVQVNEGELGLMTGAEGRSPETLLRHGPALVAVTLGGAGARYATRETLLGRPVVARSGVVPAPGGALPGDPTGCGDVWGGVLFAGLLGGLPLTAAIERAHRCAARKIRAPGTAGLRAELAKELASG